MQIIQQILSIDVLKLLICSVVDSNEARGQGVGIVAHSYSPASTFFKIPHSLAITYPPIVISIKTNEMIPIKTDITIKIAVLGAAVSGELRVVVG